MTNQNPSPWLQDQLRAAETDEQRKQILQEWDKQKLDQASEKENKMLNRPSALARMLVAIKQQKDKILAMYRDIYAR